MAWEFSGVIYIEHLRLLVFYRFFFLVNLEHKQTYSSLFI